MALCPGLTETPLTTKINLSNILFPDLVAKELEYYPMQKAEVVAKSVIEILQQREGGSVWVINDKELYKVNMPRLDTLKLLAKDSPKLLSETSD
ncbi:hypothetical protein Trydic_g17807 [Trypoxylus dichotomus]